MKNALDQYGTPEMIDIGGALRRMRPTEIHATDHLCSPKPRTHSHPEELIECRICHEQKHYTLFDRDERNIFRFGRRSECKACRKKERMAGILALLNARRQFGV